MDPDGPIFITGLDRSGKTRLRRFLGAHPDLHLVRHVELWTRDDDVSGNIADDAARAQGIAATYSAQARDHGKPRWGEQDAEIERRAERVQRMLPSARIVHLVRDPRRRYASIVAGEGRRAGRLGSTTASWIASVRRGSAHAARYPRRYLLVRDEDLDARPRAELERLHEFLGLSVVPDMVEGWSTQPPELAELRPAEVTFIEAWAGTTMRTMGYAPSAGRTALAAWHPVELAGLVARGVREARSGRRVTT
jgi:hypothetical protein